MARLAVTGEKPEAVLVAPKVEAVIEPDAQLDEAYREKIARFRALYKAVKTEFQPERAGEIRDERR